MSLQMGFYLTMQLNVFIYLIYTLIAEKNAFK